MSEPYDPAIVGLMRGATGRRKVRATKRSMGTIMSNEGARESSSSIPLQEVLDQYVRDIPLAERKEREQLRIATALALAARTTGLAATRSDSGGVV